MTRCLLLSLLTAALLPAQAPNGFIPWVHFAQNCAKCHGNPDVPRAHSQSSLRGLTPEAIYAAITTGSMSGQAAGLSDADKRTLSEYIAERRLGISAMGDVKAMTNACASKPKFDDLSPHAWNGFGLDAGNTRYQTTAGGGIAGNDIPKLKLKWAFGFPGVSQVWGQPSVVSGTVFIGVDTGYVYAIDAKSGCVHWSFLADTGVRTAPRVDVLPNKRAVAWFGDLKANAYAVDASTGALIWKTNLDPHARARISAAPAYLEGRLYFPVSSTEEVSPPPPLYLCCTFRGSVAALDAASGRKIWQTYTIAEAPHPAPKDAKNVQPWGPAGGAVWGTPVIDSRKEALYIATGDAYTEPAAPTTDAVMALDVKTGKVLWSVQDMPNDAWVLGCPNPDNPNCPQHLGEDFDFGAATILTSLSGGKRVLLAGQKSGTIWAHDPDAKGVILWRADVARSKADPRGEIVWGGAVDTANAYYGLTSGGVAAVRLTDGKKIWLTPIQVSGKPLGTPGAVTAIPGAVFSGGLDGRIRALSPEDGSVIWEYDTAKETPTVNGITGKGGSVGAPGPVVAGGMLYVDSGYIGVVGGMPGNLLLAFAPE
jgi:polyvinyl alcohol dehydrogenase (cytochrome)